MSDGGDILRTAGAVATLVTGNPLFAIGANLAAGFLFPPELPDVEGPRLSDLKQQSSTYGTPIPIVYGRARIAGNIIWIQNNELIERRIVTDSGGKGSSPTQETTTYEYYASFAVSICEGEITGVRRIWADSVLIYDAGTDVTPASVLGTAQVAKGITVYTGSETQEPNELIEADVGTAPAFRGTSYVVFERLALAKYGNRIPNMTFEVVNGTGAATQIQQTEIVVDRFSSQLVSAVGLAMSLDSNGRSTVFIPRWDNNYSTSNFTPTAIYPDGRQEIGQDAALGYNRGFFNSEPDMDEADIPLYARHTGASSRAFVVGEYDFDDDIVTIRGYYNVASTESVLNEQTSFCVRGGSIVVHNPSGNDYFIARYPDGQSAAYREMVKIVDSSDEGLTGTPYTHTHDGTTLWIVTGANKMYSYGMDFSGQLGVVDLQRTFTQIRYDVSTGRIYGQVNDSLYLIDPDTGEDTLKVTTGLASKHRQGWGVRGNLAHFLSGGTDGAGITDPGYSTWFVFDALSASTVTLASIVTDICTRSGLSGSDIDVSGITDAVSGFVHTKVNSGRADLETLAASFQFDAVQNGYTLKFVSRGSSSVVTLTEDDLAAHEYGQERPDKYIQIRERDIQIPNRIEVTSLDDDRDYDPGHQYAERLVTNAVGVNIIPLAILTTTTEASRIAEILLWVAWLERHQFEFDLPFKYSYLEPTDVVTLSVDEGSFTIRLTEVSYGSPGMVRCQGVAELPEIYTSSALGEAAQAYNQVVKLIGLTRIKFLDIPIMRDQDDDAGFYYAAGPQFGSWDGAFLYQSNDSGESYFQIDTILQQASIGVTTDALANGEHLVWDRANTVNVRMLNSATLSSATESAVLNGSNLAALGADGRWEIIKFANATLESDGTYTLDTLIRGYRGTEWAKTLHQAGDCFILLTDTTIQRFNPGADFIGNERTYKAVSFGRNIIEADEKTFSNDAVGLKPYAPVHIAATRNGSNDIVITWVRRTRVGGEWRDYVDAGIGEDSESYEVDILDAGSPDTVLRTLTSTTETVTYTAAQQTTDFGATQSSVEINVYQLSATVGRGYSGNAIV